MTDASLLSLLGDEYVADILQALAEGPLAARPLADQCGMSRTTAYRRLERLSDAGLVESQTTLGRDEPHRQEFRLVLDELRISIGEDGLECTLTVGGPAES